MTRAPVFLCAARVSHPGHRPDPLTEWQLLLPHPVKHTPSFITLYKTNQNIPSYSNDSLTHNTGQTADWITFSDLNIIPTCKLVIQTNKLNALTLSTVLKVLCILQNVSIQFVYCS